MRNLLLRQEGHLSFPGGRSLDLWEGRRRFGPVSDRVAYSSVGHRVREALREPPRLEESSSMKRTRGRTMDFVALHTGTARKKGKP